MMEVQGVQQLSQLKNLAELKPILEDQITDFEMSLVEND